MKGIKFRGLDGSLEWRYGYLFLTRFNNVKERGLDVVIQVINDTDDGYNGYVVDPETVGQFTGLKDKNGNDIYEGDILRYENSIEEGNGIITFNVGFLIEWDSKTVKTKNPTFSSPLYYFQCSKELEVLGNIHQNPELIK